MLVRADCAVFWLADCADVLFVDCADFCLWIVRPFACGLCGLFHVVCASALPLDC